MESAPLVSSRGKIDHLRPMRFDDGEAFAGSATASGPRQSREDPSVGIGCPEGCRPGMGPRSGTSAAHRPRLGSGNIGPHAGGDPGGGLVGRRQIRAQQCRGDRPPGKFCPVFTSSRYIASKALLDEWTWRAWCCRSSIFRTPGLESSILDPGSRLGQALTLGGLLAPWLSRQRP